MARIPEERRARYRALMERGMFDVDIPELAALLDRARDQGADLFTTDFSPLGMFRLPHRRDLAGVDIVCLGVPLDRGVPNDRSGTRLGPRAVRQWSGRYSLNDVTGLVPFAQYSTIDWGDVPFERRGFDLDGNLEELADLFREFKAANVAPLAIGGEHTLTYGVLKGLTRDGDEPVGLVHIDAHGDTAGNWKGHRVTDANLFAVAAVDGFIDPERTVQIGLRSRTVAIADPFAHGSGMRTIRAREVKQRGVAEVVAEARKKVGPGPVYVSFDTDAIDVSEMPGTTLPEPFGLSGWEARELLLGLRGLDVVGADLVELSPTYDPTGMSACLAAGLAFELVCLLADARAARGEPFRPTSWIA